MPMNYHDDGHPYAPTNMARCRTHPNRPRCQYWQQRRQGARELRRWQGKDSRARARDTSASRTLGTFLSITLFPLLNIYLPLDYVFGMNNHNERVDGQTPHTNSVQHGNNGHHATTKATTHCETSMDGAVNGCKAVRWGAQKKAQETSMTMSLGP